MSASAIGDARATGECPPRALADLLDVVPIQKIVSNHLAMAAPVRYLATMNEKSTLERALELARQSNCRTVEEIRRTLKTEGYSNIEQHLVGASIKKQLNAAILARSSATDAVET